MYTSCFHNTVVSSCYSLNTSCLHHAGVTYCFSLNIWCFFFKCWDERLHPYSLTYGQSILCFYIMGLGANFTTREVASSANSCANCHYDIYEDTCSTFTGNRFPWLYINCFQSHWFQCIMIESGIFLRWLVSRGGGGGGLHVSKETGGGRGW